LPPSPYTVSVANATSPPRHVEPRGSLAGPQHAEFEQPCQRYETPDHRLQRPHRQHARDAADDPCSHGAIDAIGQHVPAGDDPDPDAGRQGCDGEQCIEARTEQRAFTPTIEPFVVPHPASNPATRSPTLCSRSTTECKGTRAASERSERARPSVASRMRT
jgi:hypothetical protein